MVTEGCFCVFPNSAGTVSIRIDCLKRNQHYFNLCFVEKWLSLQLTAERKLCSCSFYSYRLWEQYHSTIFPTCMVKYHSKEEISLANNICGQGSKETWLNEGKKIVSGPKPYQYSAASKVKEPKSLTVNSIPWYPVYTFASMVKLYKNELKANSQSAIGGSSSHMIVTSFFCWIQSTSFHSFPHSLRLQNAHFVQGIVLVLLQNPIKWEGSLRHQRQQVGRVIDIQ